MKHALQKLPLRKLSFYGKHALVIIWMAVIFTLSNEPSEDSSSRSAFFTGIATDYLHVSLSDDILTFLTRKAAHIFIYFVLGILIYNVVRSYGISRRQMIALSIAVAFVYAGSDELHQLLVPGRSGEVRDVLIDTTAAGVGVAIYCGIDRLRTGHRRTGSAPLVK